MRPALLTVAMLCATTNAAAQSHEPAAKGVSAAKAVPLVSRITAAPKPSPAATATAEAPVRGTPKPRVSGATARATSTKAPDAEGHDAPAPHGAKAVPEEHATVVASAAPQPRTPVAKGPAKLATVHERIAAALKEVRGESKGDGETPGGPKPAGAPARARRPAVDTPRYVVTWPVVRWRVAWRDDAVRMTVARPE